MAGGNGRYIRAIQVQLRALGEGAGGACRVGVELAQRAGDEESFGRLQPGQFAAQPVQVLGAGLRFEVDHQQRPRAFLHQLPERLVATGGVDDIGQRRLAAQGNQLAAEELGERAFGEVRPGEQHTGVRGCVHGFSR
ncbi:hypothetical protein FQZ97_833540 [compost metagenome]